LVFDRCRHFIAVGRCAVVPLGRVVRKPLRGGAEVGHYLSAPSTSFVWNRPDGRRRFSDDCVGVAVGRLTRNALGGAARVSGFVVAQNGFVAVPSPSAADGTHVSRCAAAAGFARGRAARKPVGGRSGIERFLVAPPTTTTTTTFFLPDRRRRYFVSRCAGVPPGHVTSVNPPAEVAGPGRCFVETRRTKKRLVENRRS